MLSAGNTRKQNEHNILYCRIRCLVRCFSLFHHQRMEVSMMSNNRRIFWSDVKQAVGLWPRTAKVSVEKTTLVIKLFYRKKAEAMEVLKEIEESAGQIK